LRKFLILGNGLPGHNGFARLFRILGLAGFSRAFAAFADDPGADGAGLPASHGKMLRRFFVRGKSPVCATSGAKGCESEDPAGLRRVRLPAGARPQARGSAPADRPVIRPHPPKGRQARAELTRLKSDKDMALSCPSAAGSVQSPRRCHKVAARQT
jgi:hypothetical protein